MHSGPLHKMKTELSSPVNYSFVLADQSVPANPMIGAPLSLQFTGDIACIHCGRKIKKSFNQGYCYPCFTSLAQCDMCIVRPEQCHYDQGTCREPEWGLRQCMQDHFVYLANSSGIKVGITRKTQIPTRWIDQGATQALAILRVGSRLQAGLIEVALKEHVSDRTSWQKMLKGVADEVDLEGCRDELLSRSAEQIDEVRQKFGEDAIETLVDSTVTRIEYPILHYPSKVKSFNFDKTPEVSGVLHGIKGQYLIFDTGVINIRKFGGYTVDVVPG